MPFLMIGGHEVPVAADAAEMTVEVIGERARAFDGTLRSTQRTVKRRWQLTTPPLPAGEADVIWSVLTGVTDVVPAQGELLGDEDVVVPCGVEPGTVKFVTGPQGPWRVLQFTLVEA